MAKRKSKEPPARLDYSTQAEPRAVTTDGIPVFCSHDALIAIEVFSLHEPLHGGLVGGIPADQAVRPQVPDVPGLGDGGSLG